MADYTFCMWIFFYNYTYDYEPFLSTKHKPQPEHLDLSKPVQIFTCAWNVHNLSNDLSHFVHFNELLHIW